MTINSNVGSVSQIGLMREGRLLAEESPSRLLEIFNTDTLENVFLILSRRQEEGRLDNLNKPTSAPQSSSVLDSSTVHTGSTISVTTASETFASTDVREMEI